MDLRRDAVYLSPKLNSHVLSEERGWGGARAQPGGRDGAAQGGERGRGVRLRPGTQPRIKLRIVTLGVSGGRSLTRPLRDARRFPATRWYPVLGATRTTLGFGICSSFKGHFLSRRAKPLNYDSQGGERRRGVRLRAGETLPLPVFPTGDLGYRGIRSAVGLRYRFTV